MNNAFSGVEIFDVRRIRFAEKAWHPISEPDRLTMERAWSEAVQENPNLFDGPTVACMNVEWKEPGSLVLSWARAAYRYRMLRQISDAPSVSSVFVCAAQPTEDGRLLVARMSSSTSTPGRWQLPGAPWSPLLGVSLSMWLCFADMRPESLWRSSASTHCLNPCLCGLSRVARGVVSVLCFALLLYLPNSCINDLRLWCPRSENRVGLLNSTGSR